MPLTMLDNHHVILLFCLMIDWLIDCLFRAASTAYEVSQATGPIGAVALACARATAMRDPSLV